MNALKTIRNNWKKSVFFAGVLSYGGSYGYDKYRINRLMRSVCAEAVQYGNELLPPEANNRHVIVLLNPTANKRSAESSYEKYCAPILHLAGIRVDVVKTESEGFARTYVESQLASLPDAILIAGGDGTVSEVVTGLIRRGAANSCPIGVLPVGRTNTVAGRIFFQDRGTVEDAQGLANAAISVVRGEFAQKDVLKIELLPEEGDDPANSAKKPIYAMASIKWGAFRDAMAVRDKYWYFGGLREKAAIFFNAFKSSALNWRCTGRLTTTPACEGCITCYQNPNHPATQVQGRSRWSIFVPKTQKQDDSTAYLINGVDIRTRQNPNCGVKTELALDEISELYLNTNNVEEMPSAQLNLRLGCAGVSALDWIQDSWRRTAKEEEAELQSSLLTEPKAIQTMELIPEMRKKTSSEEEKDGKSSSDGPDRFYSIDNEDFEVKPIRVTLLPRHINMYTMSATMTT